MNTTQEFDFKHDTMRSMEVMAAAIYKALGNADDLVATAKEMAMSVVCMVKESGCDFTPEELDGIHECMIDVDAAAGTRLAEDIQLYMDEHDKKKGPTKETLKAAKELVKEYYGKSAKIKGDGTEDIPFDIEVVGKDHTARWEITSFARNGDVSDPEGCGTYPDVCYHAATLRELMKKLVDLGILNIKAHIDFYV